VVGTMENVETYVALLNEKFMKRKYAQKEGSSLSKPTALTFKNKFLFLLFYMRKRYIIQENHQTNYVSI
jgi:hypothetical protein